MQGKLYWIHIAYMLAAVLFIFGIKRLSSIRSSRQGNTIASLAMVIAIGATILDLYWFHTFRPSYMIIGCIIGSAIGAYFAIKVEMTGISGPYDITVFDAVGQPVLHEYKVSLDQVNMNIQNLEKGFYMMRIKTEDSLNSARFIKN